MNPAGRVGKCFRMGWEMLAVVVLYVIGELFLSGSPNSKAEFTINFKWVTSVTRPNMEMLI